MINKILKEYVEKDNNIDTNYKAIFSKMKGEKSMKNWKKKLVSGVAVMFAVVLVGTASTQIYAKMQWDIQFKEYQNREYKYGIISGRQK